jgi:hypothetical protein
MKTCTQLCQAQQSGHLPHDAALAAQDVPAAQTRLAGVLIHSSAAVNTIWLALCAAAPSRQQLLVAPNEACTSRRYSPLLTRRLSAARHMHAWQGCHQTTAAAERTLQPAASNTTHSSHVMSTLAPVQSARQQKTCQPADHFKCIR